MPSERIENHLVLYSSHQLAEHVVGFCLVLDERILLPVTAQVNPLAQTVHCIEMLLPQPIYRIQKDVAFKSGNGLTLFMRNLLPVRSLNLIDNQLQVLL